VIVVAGEALVDEITRRDGTIDTVPGGGPFNTARAIGRLGVPVSFAGALSTDEHGQGMARSLAADGVSLDLVQRTDRPTTRALAELDERGEARYRFVVDGTSAPALDAARLQAFLPDDLVALHVGTLGLVFEPMAGALEAVVGGMPRDALLMVDPNCRPSAIPDPDAYRARMARILARADVVKLSTADEAFLGVDLASRVVVVTDAGGPVRVRVGGEARSVPVPAVTVVDTVGAGDTFGGAMLAWLVDVGVTRETVADPATVLGAVRFAIRASGVVCQRPGADPPTLAELGGWQRKRGAASTRSDVQA
jgi:fructokinase